MRYGVPYQGSKNQIAAELISVLPAGRRFVDLFAGGCAMTHAAIISGKYRTFLANDLQGFGVRLFTDAIAGKCRGRWREWVSRADFHIRKRTDPLVALCWSFSNNGRDYCYGPAKEPGKRAAHVAMANGEHHAHLDRWPEAFSRLLALERLEDLERLRALERLRTQRRTYADYAHHSAGDVVYCDPPYSGTRGYNTAPFDTEAFWAWVRSRPFPVFVSEYQAPAGFTPIWERDKYRLMQGGGTGGKATERLFVLNRYARQFGG